MAGLLARQPDSAEGGNPFQAGRGKLPPFLAGRAAEQALIREFVKTLAQRVAPACDIILCGPRGNGKAALIEWSRRDAEALKILVADLQGGSLGSDQQLAAALSLKRRWLIAWRSFKLGPTGVRSRGWPTSPVSSALDRRVRRAPSSA